MQEMLCSLELERKLVWVARRLFSRVYLRCFLPAVTEFLWQPLHNILCPACMTLRSLAGHPNLIPAELPVPITPKASIVDTAGWQTLNSLFALASNRGTRLMELFWMSCLCTFLQRSCNVPGPYINKDGDPAARC